jgi:LuxR family maltose regulon positive regulatory protein
MTRLRATEAVSIAETLEWLAHEGLGLFDYLAERVLESLSPAQRLFLRDTSVLPTVSVVAANALLHADDGFALMSAVLRLQPIVTITGDREFTIRLHPLLRQYMRNELARQGREHECELQRRAAEVLAAGGEVLGGVQHALLAADLSLAVRLFERAGGEALIFALGARRVLSLAAALPGAARAASPALRLVDVLMAAVEGRAGVTRRLRADLVHDLEATAPLPDPAWREYAVGLSDAAVTLLADPYEGIGAHDFAKLAATERLARLDFARDETKLGLILALQVLIYARHARVAEARRTLEDYVALVERNGFGPQHPSVNPQRGLLAWLEGDIDLSLASLSRNPPQRIERFAEPEPLLAQLSTVLVASMHYERDELDKAHELLDRLSVDPDRTFPETWALGARLRALTLVALGRVRQADHGLAEERERAGRRGAVRLGLMVEATRLELALRSGPDFAPVPAPDSAIVERLAAALAAEIARPDSSWLFAASLAPGVVLGLLALSQAERARALAGRWTQRSSERGHGPLEARGRLLAARAAEALDDVTGALAEILAALPLTAPGHLVRPYLDLLGRSPAMLLRVLGHLTDLKTIEHLRLVMRSCEALASSPSGWALLSERERDVLWALSAHASTKVIAKNLGVSPETVKHHLKRIFAKLGVHTREEALKRIAHLAG